MRKKHNAEQLSGEQVIHEMRRRSDTILLAFSCGKDSIAAWLALRPHFTRIVPYYMYLVPGLEFVERSLRYYEAFFGCHIARIPHRSLYRMLVNLVFQAPENCRIVEACEFRTPEYDDLIDLLREDCKLSPDVYVAHGVRAADSPIRRGAVTKYGAVNHHRKTFWPIWDWRKADVIRAINQSGVKLPIDYRWLGRSFDGLDYRFLAPIKEHAPKDYARILEFFPLAEVEIMRRQYALAR